MNTSANEKEIIMGFGTLLVIALATLMSIPALLILAIAIYDHITLN